MERIITRDCVRNLKKLSKISGIYKITNPSSKVYIGQSIDLFRRLKSYFEPNSSKNQTILKHSFGKYGRENHIFSIIEECEIYLLNERERYWQEQYKDKLLNCRLTETNDKSGICSEKTKLNISEALKKSGRSYQHLKRKIYQYDDNGIFIKEWSSLRVASRELDIQSSQLSRATKNNSPNKSAGGFLWSYEKLDYLVGSVGQDKMKVKQKDLNNNLLKEWESISLAAIETNTSKSSIIRCCKGKQKTANGFLWSY